MTLTKIKPAGLSKPVDLADNELIRLGTSNDLQIFHDGSNSYVKHNGAGSLLLIAEGSGEDVYIRANDDIFIQPSSSEDGIKVIGNGAVELYYANSKKFETITSGVTVTGDVNLTGELNMIAGSDGQRFFDARVGSSALTFRGTTGGDANHQELARFFRGGGCELNHNGSKKLETTSDGVKISGGEGIEAILTFEPDEGDNGSDKFRLRASDSSGFFLENGSSNETSIKAVFNGAVELYNAGTKRFETTSNGVIISGFTDARQDSTGAYSASAAPGNVLARFYNGSAQNNSHAALQLRASNDNAAADIWWISCVAQSQNYNGFLAFTGRTTSSASTELVRFSNNGDVSINAGNLDFASGKGIEFHNYGSGTSVSSNLLDDYEEGTFTPGTQGFNNVSYTNQNGHYTKIGRLVYVDFYIRFGSGTVGDANHIYVTNLPFNIANTNNLRGGGTTSYENIASSNDGGAGNISFYGSQGDNKFSAYVGETAWYAGDGVNQSSKYLIGTFIYTAAT
jgi:hypothetical protein